MSTQAVTRPGIATRPRPAPPVRLGRLEATRRAADEGHLVLLFGFVSVVLALLYVGLAFTRVDDARLGIDAIGREAIPSIDAADRAASLLSGMDAHSIDNALAGPGGSPTARDAFLATRGQVDQQLRGMLRASSTAAQDDLSIAGLQSSLHEYDVRYGLHTAETRLGFPLGAAQQRAASDLIDTAAIPGALAVDDARTTFLTDEFVRRQNGATAGQAAVVAGAAVVLLVLIAGQRFMARTYARVLNPMLAAGTLLVALFAVLVVRGLGAASGDLRDMAQGAHSSIHALQLARVELEHARRDQSLFLLEQGHGARYDREYSVQVSRAFCAHASAAAAADPNSACQPLTGQTAQQIAAELRGGQSFSGRPPGTLDGRYTGYLADAVRNVTHGNQELDTTLTVLGTLAVFEQVDSQMRALETNNQHTEAIALNTGAQQGQGGWAFDQVERALQSAVDLNRAHYDAALNDASGSLDLVRTAAPIVALLMVALIWLGVQPTLSRYRLP
jgi:hypothetical protein